jgi:hypothetical protein
MPLTPFCIRVATADDLEYEVNLALVTLLSNRIFGVAIDQSKPGPYFTKNIFCEFSYSTGDPAIPTPFRVRIFDANTEEEVLTLINQFVAANPAYFFSEVYFFYRTETPNPSLGVSAAIFYNVTLTAGSNWGGGAGGGSTPGPTGPLPVGTTVMDSVGIGACTGGTWEVLLQNGVLRHKALLSVAHNDVTATVSEFGSNPGPGVGVLPVTLDADINAGNLRILGIATLPGWSYRVNRLTLQTV